MPTDVARAERGDVVRDAPLRDGGTKPIVVSNDPVRHETAVAAAGHVEALRVDPAETKRVIDAGHEVFVIFPAPVADARFDEPLTVRVAPTRVREKHRVAAPHEHLELVKEGVPVSGVRPAVDLENERPLLRRIEAERFHEPALDRPRVRAGELDPLRCRGVSRRQKFVVQAARLAHRPGDLADEEVPGIGRRRHDRGEAPPRVVERPRDKLMAPNGLGSHIAAARRARVGVRRSLVGAEKENAAIAGPRGGKRLRVRAHVADHRRADRAVPRFQEIAARSARFGEGPDVDVASRGADRAVGAVGRDRRGVGRPGRVSVAALAVGDSARLARERDDVDVGDSVEVALVRPV